MLWEPSRKSGPELRKALGGRHPELRDQDDTGARPADGERQAEEMSRALVSLVLWSLTSKDSEKKLVTRMGKDFTKEAEPVLALKTSGL